MYDDKLGVLLRRGFASHRGGRQTVPGGTATYLYMLGTYRQGLTMYGWAQALERKGVKSDHTYYHKKEGSVVLRIFIRISKRRGKCPTRLSPSTPATRNELADAYKKMEKD